MVPILKHKMKEEGINLVKTYCLNISCKIETEYLARKKGHFVFDLFDRKTRINPIVFEEALEELEGEVEEEDRLTNA